MIPNLTLLALIWIGGAILLVPLMIAAVRLAVLPLIEAIMRPRAAPSTEARLARLEASVVSIGRNLEELSATAPARRTA